MSHSKAVPDGLQPQKCEWNVGWSKPSIPYIPEQDVIKKALTTTTKTLKLTLPHTVELRALVWSQGTPKHFLVLQQARNVIREKGLYVACEQTCREKEECI
jgi:hypothetical protein